MDSMQLLQVLRERVAAYQVCLPPIPLAVCLCFIVHLTGASAVGAPRSPSAKTEEPEYQRRQGAFAQVFSDVGFGMGGVVADYILTSAHVVVGAKRLTVQFPDRAQYPAVVAASDERYDLALLRVARSVLESRPQLSPATRRPEVGEAVFAYGGTLNLFPILALGRVTHLTEGLCIIDAPVQVGYEGSPVCLATGEVIGVVAFRRDSLTGVALLNGLPDLLAQAAAWSGPAPAAAPVTRRVWSRYSPHRLRALAAQASPELCAADYEVSHPNGARMLFTTPVTRLTTGFGSSFFSSFSDRDASPSAARPLVLDWEQDTDPRLLPVVSLYVSWPAATEADWRLSVGAEDAVGLAGVSGGSRRSPPARRFRAVELVLKRDGEEQSPWHVRRGPEFVQYDFPLAVFVRGRRFSLTVTGGGVAERFSLVLPPSVVNRLRRDIELVLQSARAAPR